MAEKEFDRVFLVEPVKMTEKELSQVYWLKKEFYQLQKELEELREDLMCHSIVITDMPKGISHSDSIGEYVVNIVSIEERLRGILQEIVRERCLLEDFISSIDDCEMRLIMRFRHVCGMTWEKIGKELGYSKTGVYTKYKKFMEKIEQKEQSNVVI